MLKTGRNYIDGIPVEVARKRIRRINIRIGADGVINLSVPFWRTTIAEGAAFLRSKWRWAVMARAKVLARPSLRRAPLTPEELSVFEARLGALHAEWCARLGDPGVTWRIRQLKSLWGSCHIRKRHVLYNAELARAPREYVEYVVVHELTHLRVANHGARFRRLMDERLPGWQTLRRRLNRRDFPDPRNVPAAESAAGIW